MKTTEFGLVVLLMLAVGNDSFAGRVYRLIEYPEFQDGGSLSGAITIDEDAFNLATAAGVPLRLNTGAIDRYEFTASGNGLSFSAAAEGRFAGFSVNPGSVLVTASEITVGLNRSTPNIALLSLAEEIGQGDATEKFVSLTYVISHDGSANRYSVGGTEGENRGLAWHTAPAIGDLGGEPWVIARFVPEPATALMALLAVAGGAVPFRLARSQS